MTLLPNGLSERAALEAEMTATREFQRLTQIYLAKVRELYPRMSQSTKRHVTPPLQQLRSLAGPERWHR